MNALRRPEERSERGAEQMTARRQRVSIAGPPRRRNVFAGGAPRPEERSERGAEQMTARRQRVIPLRRTVSVA